MARKRINITIDPALHEQAQEHARRVHGTDFSGLVTKLIIADLGQLYIQKNISSKADEVISLLKRVNTQEEMRLEHGPRARKTSANSKEAEHFLKHAQKVSLEKKGASHGSHKPQRGGGPRRDSART